MFKLSLDGQAPCAPAHGKTLRRAAGVLLALLATAAGAQTPGTSPSLYSNSNGMVSSSSVPDAPAKRPPSQTQKQHEAQLSAIRQAILQATLERPTRVLSSAWIDDKGALHESAQFQSEARVRGVRVLSYLQDENEAPAQVSAEVLPWGWKSAQSKGAGAACTAPPRPWRLPLVLHTRMDTGFTGRQNFASQAVLGMVSQVWTQKMQASQRWRTQLKETPPDSAYLRALTGPSQSSTGWVAEMVLKPHAPNVPFSFRETWNNLGKDEADWRWTLSFTLGQRLNPAGPIEPHWQIDQVLAIDPQALSQQPSAWSQAMKEQLQQQMLSWVQQLDERSECEPIQFHVRRNGNEPLQLQAGFESGLRAGDRVLLMHPSHIPSQMLEPGATQHLALAQVVKVGPDRTELQQVAGPALAAQGHWMALPL